MPLPQRLLSKTKKKQPWQPQPPRAYWLPFAVAVAGVGGGWTSGGRARFIPNFPKAAAAAAADDEEEDVRDGVRVLGVVVVEESGARCVVVEDGGGAGVL